MSEKQIPQVVRKFSNYVKSMELLEPTSVLRRQTLYPTELRAH
jgi:hypothetical protein